MGNLTSRGAQGLEVSTANGPVAHRQLGFPVTFPVDLVFDADKTGQDANKKVAQKWMWYNSDADKLMLNPFYKLDPIETEFFILHFIIQTLKTEASMEAFYGPQTTEYQRMRMVGGSQQTYDLMTSDDFKRTYNKWALQNSTYWCNLSGLNGDDLVKNVKGWLRDRNQPTSGSAPHELFARFCALSTMSLKPAPRIMRWAAALKLGLEQDPDAAVRIYCRVHLLASSSPSSNGLNTRPVREDPFWILKNELIREANQSLKQHDIRELVKTRKWQGPVPGLPLCGDPNEMRSQVALFRFKHVSRDYLTLAITNLTHVLDIQGYDTQRHSSRENDLVLGVLMGQKPVTAIKKIPEFVSFTHRDWGTLQDDVEGYSGSARKQQPIRFNDMDDMQYIDYLLEYGFPNLVMSSLFPHEVLRAVAAHLQINEEDIEDVRSKVIDVLSDHLTEPWLESWLEDRNFSTVEDANLPLQSRIDFLRRKYLDYSSCLYLDSPDETCLRLAEKISDSLRPNFKMFNEASASKKLIEVPEMKATTEDIGEAATMFTDPKLIEALHLISDTVFSDDPLRLQRLCAILNIPYNEETANLKVFEVLIARLSPDSSLLDVLINMTSEGPKSLFDPLDPQRVNVIKKLQLLTRVNQLRREAMSLPQVQKVFQERKADANFNVNFHLAPRVVVSEQMLDNYRSWYSDTPEIMVAVQQRVIVFESFGKPLKSIQMLDATTVQLFTLNNGTGEWEAETHPPWTFAEAHAELIGNQGYRVAQVA